jgi:hypothetical protein
LPNLLVDWVQRIAVPPSAGQPFPTPQFPPVVAGTGIDSTIKNIYNAVEPWVRYGFDLAAYAVGWIPYVGWLAPQITIFYNFGERIARSITFNIADWLGGNVNFVQGLINVGVDTINSFIQLGIDEWNFFLPPLPPLPPFPFAATQATTKVTAAAVTGDVTTETATPTGTPKLNKKRGADQGEVLGEGVDAAEDATATTSSSGVAAQGEVRGAPNEKKTESAAANNRDKTGKKGEDGQTAEAASGASASATTSDGTGTKHAKKDATSKKDDTGNK